MKGLYKIRPDALVLSIVAGASIQKIGKALKHQAVVRSMPNTPGQIGEGITVWTASAKTSKEQQEMARSILGALGEEVFVEDEVTSTWQLPSQARGLHISFSLPKP